MREEEIAKANVLLYARRLTIGTATVEELSEAFRWYDEVRGMAPQPVETVQ